MTPAAPVLLDVCGLRGGYGAVEVLRDVDLQVAEGEIVALLGSNGAGKSTLNHLLSGIYPAWAGTVRFDGLNLSGAHARLVGIEGLAVRVQGLDAVDGTPVLDLKPVLSGFLPRGPVVEPSWSLELMAGYWGGDHLANPAGG